MRIGLFDRLPAQVSTLRPGPVSVDVLLALPSGDELRAVVTRDSATLLGLAPGATVLALPLAPGVLLATDGEMSAAETRWSAVVEQVTPGPLNVLIHLRTDRGTRLHAVLTRTAAAELGLAVGASTTVCVLASQVMLAAPADAVSDRGASDAAALARGR